MLIWCYKPYMTLRETVILGPVVVRIYLEGEVYRLSYGDVVVYENGRRRVHGRWAPYEFRSVEQLRYDFERDVESMGGSLA
jgi:hypothetical protein